MMIERYSRPAMQQLWGDKNRYAQWLRVELAVCRAWARRGKIPAEDLQAILAKAGYDVKRIQEIEADLKHDVIAFLTNVAEFVGPAARYIHQGMTSSDVLDTALALQLAAATDLMLADLVALKAVLKKRAYEFKDVPTIGRSHGIHAEPTSFGLKWALWYAEFERHTERLRTARRAIAVGKISGAVGTFAHLDPTIEAEVCQELALDFEPVSTQVVQRDRHAHYFSVLAGIAASIEKVALEIRHLQRTEVREVFEPFGEQQKGSSAMPHKKNPVLSENLTGLARLVRAYAQAALEDVALWHERDISHSSVERIIAPDATTLVDFMLTRLQEILEGLVVDRARIGENLASLKGVYHSQRVLLALTQKGMLREAAYKLVQRHALRAWEEGADFLAGLENDPQIMCHLSAQELAGLFDSSVYLRNVDFIFNRVFGAA